jgi:hypothetical protein
MLMLCRGLVLLVVAGASISCSPAANNPDVVGVCTIDGDCPGGYNCLQNVCRIRQCDPGVLRCVNDRLEVCAADAQRHELQSICAAGCAEDLQACADPVCVGHSARCFEGNRQRCLPGGAGWVTEQVCEHGCAEGDCIALGSRVCAPGVQRCMSDNLETCNELGTGWVHTSYCDFGCTSQGCEAPACDAEAKRCVGLAQEVCAPDRRSWQHRRTCADRCIAETGECDDLAGLCREDATRCSGRSIDRCTANGSWEQAQVCDSACLAGACVTCVPGARQCDELQPMVCDADGAAFANQGDVCGQACVDGRCGICSPGTRSCAGDVVTLCTGDGQREEQIANCLTSCREGGCTLCRPAARRCHGSGVQECSAEGDVWAVIEDCGGGCRDGACVGGQVICVPGQRRCTGQDVQVCGHTGTRWLTLESCMGRCGAGTCDDDGACNPFALTVGPTPMRKDGQSSALVVSAPIRRGNGDPIADGTKFTIRVTGAVIQTVDQDLDRAGVQVVSNGGMIDFGVRSIAHEEGEPLGQAHIEVVHTRALRCAGVVDVDYTGANANPHRALDFSDFDAADMSSTILPEARTTVLPGFPTAFGDARDGDFVGPGDMADTMRYAPVAALSDRSVTTTSNIVGLAVGDEVILINLQGSPIAHENLGNYEFFRIASIDIEQHTYLLDRPITKVYGAFRNNNDLTGQVIALQRVPNFRNVSGLVWNDQVWSRSGGGVLVFRARYQTGQVNHSSAGYGPASGLYYYGESYAGRGQQEIVNTPNFGAGASGYSIRGQNCNYYYNNRYHNDGCRGTAGHREIGHNNPWANGAGSAYGAVDLDRLTMGSGSSLQSGIASGGSSGGGIVAVFAEEMNNSSVISSVCRSRIIYQYQGAPNLSCPGVYPSHQGNGIRVYPSGKGSGGSIYVVSQSISGSFGFSPALELTRMRVDAAAIAVDLPDWIYRGRFGDGAFTTQSISVGHNEVRRARIVMAPQTTLGGEMTFALTNSARDGDNALLWHAVEPNEWFVFPVNETGDELKLRVEFAALNRDPLALNGIALEWQTD